MKVKIKIEKEVELKNLIVNAEPRYWEDSSIDGVSSSEIGEFFPCKNGDNWQPVIDIESGKILNWDFGKKAVIHFKTADQCAYSISDINGGIVLIKDWSYVPDILCPVGDGFGDYIIMDIDENGVIDKWEKEKILECFESEDD